MAETAQANGVGWVDLTVDDADGMRDFYAAVAGWKPTAVSMGDYADYVMAEPVAGTPVAGVCHQRGVNAGLPRVWLVYFLVTDLDSSLAECRARGGKIISGPKSMSETDRYAVIEDPSGAACALYQRGK